MTLPTSFPRRFPEVRFPFEFSELYGDASRMYFNDAPMTGGAHQKFGNPFGGETVNTMYHARKHEDSNRMVGAQIVTDRVKDFQQLTNAHNSAINRQINTESVRGGCHTCEDYKDMRGGLMNMMSPSTIEGANVLAGRGMRGGVMRTQAGAQYLQKRLTERISELDTVSSGVLGVGEEDTGDSDKITEDEDVLISLGEHLDNILDGVATGNIDSSTVNSSRAFLSGLLKTGWMIPSNQLVSVLRNVDETIQELQASLGNKAPTYQLTADKKKVARQSLTVLERAKSVVDQLVKKSYLSPSERKMVLSSFRPKLKQQLQAQLESQIPGRMDKYTRNNEPVTNIDNLVDDGAFAATYAVAKRPSWYVSLAAIPGSRRLPRQVAERIARM